MNNYIKRIVTYGLFQGATFIFILTAISYWISSNSFSTALTLGVIGGTIVGIFSSLISYKYAVPKYILDTVSIDTDIDEEIKFQTPANYTNGKEPVSGKLFLTDKRVIFRNHKHDKNMLQFSIDLADIDEVATFKTLKLFENGLSILTTSKVTHKFIVDRVKQWLNQFDKNENDLQQKYLQKQVGTI